MKANSSRLSKNLPIVIPLFKKKWKQIYYKAKSLYMTLSKIIKILIAIYMHQDYSLFNSYSQLCNYTCMFLFNKHSLVEKCASYKIIYLFGILKLSHKNCCGFLVWPKKISSKAFGHNLDLRPRLRASRQYSPRLWNRADIKLLIQ